MFAVPLTEDGRMLTAFKCKHVSCTPRVNSLLLTWLDSPLETTTKNTYQNLSKPLKLSYQTVISNFRIKITTQKNTISI